MKTGTELIAEERADQIRKGWDAEHDDSHEFEELAEVAAVVVASGTNLELSEEEDWGICLKHENNRIHQLAIAGALIAAEIDRLLRKGGAMSDPLETNTQTIERLTAERDAEKLRADKAEAALSALADMVWESRWVSQDADYQTAVGTAAEIRSGNLDCGRLNTFGSGVVSMARNCQAAIDLVHRGTWTLDKMNSWLVAVIANDAKFLSEVKPELEAVVNDSKE